MAQTPSDNQKLMQKIEMKRKNNAAGAFFGLIVGDALGAAVEFKKRDSFKKITDMRSDGPHGLEAGYWTDDSSMALCLAESLSKKGFNQQDQLLRYLDWYRNGYLSSTGSCFDIGANTAHSLEFFEENEKLPPVKDRAAGNGSLMRLAPVPIFFRDDFMDAVKYSGESSLTTHNNQMAIDSCRYFGGLLQQFINARIEMDAFKVKVIKDTAVDLNLNDRVILAVKGAFQKNRSEIKSDGFVINTLEASIWSFLKTDSFKEALILAANLGDDADTVAAVTGQLAGAYYGYDSIPKKWTAKLAKPDLLEKIFKNLYNH
ncbi:MULTISPECIES: ADP-ribosylglycohydrolase family protein [Halanaerobium]|uniref:ADP-ribosyl-[dinitrogen reductase] hydrolase n=1 Tax=Halanaerobium kushneri TaxID=56779 RepID=A0A1N6PD62_9FIRM|nr:MULTISPECIES: ADP-ribosylglycohydrolase family protein [Halanaerobium]RCW58738.1 ADP-ribosyl-[dinitrogen reductase] hydrolase [Halanaerobium sp. ST460_2HS_T2]SIQ02176.1 ADP-ribosyl-[dinitrogen reductase] hydrolase [Halanaerobium kushneri]